MYLNRKAGDQFEKLFSSFGNRSVLINEKAWRINSKRHCLPAEELWLNPPAYPQITASQFGDFYAKSIERDAGNPEGNNRSKGKTFVYQVVGGKDELLDMYAWFDLRIYLQGRNLVRIGTWGQGVEPNERDLAIGFYQAGQTVKEYSTLDIVNLGYSDPQKIEKMNSHYQVLKGVLGYQALDSAAYSFDVETAEGMILSFDPTTGALIKKTHGKNRD